MRRKEKKMSITTKKAILGVLALIGAALCAIALQMSSGSPENWIFLLTGRTFCFAFCFFWISACIDIYRIHKMHRR